MKTIVRTLRNVSVATLTVSCLCFLFFNGNIQPNFVVAQNQDDAQMLAVLTPADAQKIMAAEEVQTTVAEAKPIRDRNRNLERNRNRDRNQDRNRDQIRRRAASGVNIEQPTVPGIEIISQPINPPAPWIASQPITPPALTQEQLEAISIQPAVIFKETGSRVVPAMLPLFKEESITYNVKDEYPRKNSVLKYRLHVPENMEKGKKYPLILWLHGAGEVGDDNKLQLVHLHHIITYLTGEKKRDFFLLVPQAPRNHASWDAGSYSQVLPKELTDTLSQNEIIEQYKSASEPRSTISLTKMDDETVLTISRPVDDSPLGYSFAMLDQVMKNYPVDKDRITVSGLSTGGDGTWRALERRPELFAAAVPLVSWDALTDGALSQSPVLKKIPIWAIYSSDDNGIDQARTDFERVEKAGCNVKKSEFGICGHNAWTPAMLQADIFSWLLSR
ncbi:MAG: hypothetical protein LBK06_02670, partial [Planctomycetaceae bacterium]|nr:hypothetical protein [Planctomycetaceae bacterium]